MFSSVFLTRKGHLLCIVSSGQLFRHVNDYCHSRDLAVIFLIKRYLAKYRYQNYLLVSVAHLLHFLPLKFFSPSKNLYNPCENN